MILDKETYLASSVAVTTAAVLGGTVVDLVKPNYTVRPHAKIPVVIPVAFVAAVGTPGTAVTFELLVADNDALTSNPVVVASSGAVPIASLTKDAMPVVFDYPSNLSKRHFGIKATPTGEFSAGKFSAFVTMDAPHGYAVK